MAIIRESRLSLKKTSKRKARLSRKVMITKYLCRDLLLTGGKKMMRERKDISCGHASSWSLSI